ncbi:phage infection protein [Enterococcus sp. JM4C]|uniref:YhgE/Pip domain-containing protein n=1 Tax=Candidatus Enterococcus huntleyi TaxID=1857217 RepID=UPI00137A61FF|nr:YhgE/Pip domain-containing protein [Enterococcus sp. JM4C]KAF1299520.1 phage infection protein [Enterococcus sp. JM4C]
MNHIKNTFKLFVLDWRRIFRNPIATLLIIALMIIPSLYAWFNIKALWDPYGNTGELPIAVYSADKSTTFQDKEVAIGDEVMKSLHKNKQLGWRFVDSKKELDDGVKSGEYYAGIYLPEDFSTDLLSFTTGDIKKPTIEYSINEKINAIAPKIADKGASSIQAQITDEFTKTASSTLIKVFNEIGYDLDSNLVSITKVKDMILSTDKDLDKIEGYTKEVIELNNKMPELKDKLAKANEFVEYVPKVNEMGEKLIALNDKMPQLKQQAAIILTLQSKIPEIQNAGAQLAQVDNDFDSIEQTMNEGIDEAKTGLQIIQQVQTAMPDIKELGNQASDLSKTTSDALGQFQTALPGITTSIKVTLETLGDVSSDVVSITGELQDVINDNQLTDEEKAAAISALSHFSEKLANQLTAIDDLMALFEKIQALPDGPDLSGQIEKLNNLKTLIQGMKTRIDGVVAAGPDAINVDGLQALLGDINAFAGSVNTIVSGIDPEAISTQISTILSKSLAALKNADDLLAKVKTIDFDSLLSSTKTTVSRAIDTLEKYQKQMPAIRQEIHDANTLLNGHMDEIVNGINKGADLYNNELPVLESKLGLAANFIQNDWPDLEKEITTTLKTVNDKMPMVESALSKATDLINNDWPSIKSGISKAADAIRKGESEVDLGQVIKLLKLDANKESDFFTQPVNLKTNQLYPIANNGSASTPFYTALCLWVGAVLFSSIATTDYFLKEKDKRKYSKREQFSARMLTFLTMGLAQGLIVTLGNYFLLGVDVRHPVYSVLFGLLIALTFMMMVYVLVALFGNVGKGIAIIILVLSISGGGGNYPIQVSGKFFQMINPFLPFTHAVNLLRESAGGIYWPNAMNAIWIMIALFVVFAIVGVWFYPYIETQMKKLTKISHESHIFH